MAKEKQGARSEHKMEALDSLERIRGEHFIRFYANNIQVSFSTWDMRLTFGEIVDQPDGKTVIEDRACVVMSLQHAKAAIAALVRSFTALEKQFGEIKLLEVPQQQ
jgi:hypothetical protein